MTTTDREPIGRLLGWLRGLCSPAIAVCSCSAWYAILLAALLAASVVSPLKAQTAVDIRRVAGALPRSLDLQMEFPRTQPDAPDTPINVNFDLVRVLVWIAVICGAAVLAWYVRDILPASRLTRRTAWDPSSEFAPLDKSRSDEEAQLAADELARRGCFVEAMHALLLESLSELRKRLDMRFSDSLTSREIMRRANISAAAGASLQDIIGWVERAYFGDHPVGADDYLACRRSFAALSEALRNDRHV